MEQFPKLVSQATLNEEPSVLDQVDPAKKEPSVFDQVDPVSEEAVRHLFADEREHETGENNEGDTASAFSNYSTPISTVHRPGTTFATAKKWLAAWLKDAGLYHCAITLTPIAPHRMNQMAHIMLPQSAPANAVSSIFVQKCLPDIFFR